MFRRIFALFFILAFAFIPLATDENSIQHKIVVYLFSGVIEPIQGFLFDDALDIVDFSSDSISLNLLIILLFILSCIIVTSSRIFKVDIDWLSHISLTVALYYLVFVMLKYGFNKVFKHQFYLPEPNILYSQFGILSKDILYWSTMGTSYLYSLITGLVEVAIGLMLLIRKTKVLGLLAAMGVMLNIVLVNFSFDISVKTFSLFLTATILFCLSPYFKDLYTFFLQSKKKLVTLNYQGGKLFKITSSLKFLVSILIFAFVLLPYLFSGNFNDDAFGRPFLHGAYKVEQMFINDKPMALSDMPFRRLYVHRNNYMIFEDKDGGMTDHYIQIDKGENRIILFNYQEEPFPIEFNYLESDSILSLQFWEGKGNKIKVVSKAMNWKNLPVFKTDFHLTIDQVK